MPRTPQEMKMTDQLPEDAFDAGVLQEDAKTEEAALNREAITTEPVNEAR